MARTVLEPTVSLIVSYEAVVVLPDELSESERKSTGWVLLTIILEWRSVIGEAISRTTGILSAPRVAFTTKTCLLRKDEPGSTMAAPEIDA